MDQEPRTGSAPVTDTPDPEQIQREIEQTRKELGSTVEALAHKADVKAQARQKAQHVKASVAEKTPDSASELASQASQTARQKPVPVAAGGAFLAGFLIGRLTRR